MGKFDNKSISELEGWKWKGEIPKEDEWHTEYRFYQLHKKPLNELDLSDIYFLILENSGLEYLVPKAIEKLNDDLFLEVENYSGDLFRSLLLINNEPNYWNNHPKEKQELIELYQSQKKRLGSLGLPEDVLEKIKEAYKAFAEK